MHRVGILGASGYAGLELVRLLAGHTHIELAFAGSEKFIGRQIDELAPGLGALGDRRFVGTGEALELALGCDVSCSRRHPRSRRRTRSASSRPASR